MQRMAARAFHCLRLQSERSPTVVDKTGEGMEAGENGFLDQRAPAQVCAREEGHERGLVRWFTGKTVLAGKS